ncbi:hypothetical protein F2Q68_00041308 [Brassica cretica]|uniref:Cyclin-dependent kinase inhibitor domain-containing protein n=1 Tax=Brassica cretica TaxID=69181 RepID=A0A8S9MBJ1_BRACR|nr:hypothetical protein F2Q68_00041308 [Brassica cretica]
MAAGEVGRRREGETADENEKTNAKRRKLEEEEESRILILSQNPSSERVPEEEESVNEVESCRVNKQKGCETVKEAEIEDFFQAAEKDVRNNMLECSSKYSFDFEKDEPLDGRYEWVKLNP